MNVHATTRYANAEGIIARTASGRGDVDGPGQTQHRRRREICKKRQPGVEGHPAPTVPAKVTDVYSAKEQTAAAPNIEPFDPKTTIAAMQTNRPGETQTRPAA